MGMHEEWKAISERICSLIQAGKIQAAFLNVNRADSYATSAVLRRQAGELLRSVSEFGRRFPYVLPDAGRALIEKAGAEISKLVTDESVTQDTRQQQAWAALVQLAAFESEMSFILSDVQETLRARSERAFAHLQRSIVVDSEFQGKWVAAFKKHETACEKLGAVHLLLHGLWAFKVSGAGAQTDLVFEDAPTGVLDPIQYADGLVLTEWKIAKNGSEVTRRFEEARAQAAKYKRGILAGSELTQYRFAVLVTTDYVPVPSDIRQDDAVVRHINIAVQPSLPSQN